MTFKEADLTTSQEGAKRFQPKDYPDLWQQLNPEVNPRGVRIEELAGNERLIEMLVPRELWPEGGFSEVLVILNSLQLSIDINGQNFFINTGGYRDLGDRDMPPSLEISDYEAHISVPGSTQIIYRNLLHQFGNIGTPVQFGQVVPQSIGFFIHRVGRVPVGLINQQYRNVREGIGDIKGKTPEQLRYDKAYFNFTVSVHGVKPGELVTEDALQRLRELEQTFNGLSPSQRQSEYPRLLAKTFNLKPFGEV